jgi:hypothetical protein
VAFVGIRIGLPQLITSKPGSHSGLRLFSRRQLPLEPASANWWAAREVTTGQFLSNVKKRKKMRRIGLTL